MNRKMLQRPGIKLYTRHTDREVGANRPDIITTNKKVKTCILIDVTTPVDRICNAKGSGKEAKIQEFMYTDTTNVQHEMNYYTGKKWSHRNRNKRFKENFGSQPMKTFNRFTTEDS
jgi:hypothetical protein